MSYIASYFHCVFGTKDRQKLITGVLQERLWPFMGGIARELGMTALIIGGMEDHVHLLLTLPATLTVARAMQQIKGGSAKWVHDTFPEHWRFGWQEEYGAFSVSVSQLSPLTDYIKNQPEHHRTRTFREEFEILLKRHGIKWDERYFWR